MPRHGMKKPEKVKDLKGTLIRIFKNLNRWRYILVLSCILAMFAAILSTIAPNKLADLTDVISEGVKPNVEVLQRVSESIMNTAPPALLSERSFKKFELDILILGFEAS